MIWMQGCVQQRIACIFFFFFQAEDGIRDLTVTGVQTCALPISEDVERVEEREHLEVRADREDVLPPEQGEVVRELPYVLDRKSTRLNSSHSQISYAVFCLKKKKKKKTN